MAEIASAVWHDTIEHLADGGLLTTRTARIADRYSRSCAEYEVLYPEAVRLGPVRKGPKGGDVWNMLWGAVKDLNTIIAKLEADLLIAPRAANAKVEPPKGDKKRPTDEFFG